MADPLLVLTDHPTDAGERVIGGGLPRLRRIKSGYREWRELAALLRDPDTGETLVA